MSYRGIYRAWFIKGPVPSYHKRMQDKVRKAMPLLGSYLDDMEPPPPPEVEPIHTLGGARRQGKLTQDEIQKLRRLI